MELKNAMALRQACRAFQPQQISDEALQALLTAACTAPASMGQFENVRLTVVQDAKTLEQIDRLFAEKVGNPDMRPTYGAPTVIFVSHKAECEPLLQGVNASCVMENLLLAAADQGLGSVYLFGVSQELYDNETYRKLLKLPDGFRTVAAAAVGVPAQPLQPRDTAGRYSIQYV